MIGLGHGEGGDQMSFFSRLFRWRRAPVHYSSVTFLNRGHRVTVEGDEPMVKLHAPGLDGAARFSPETARRMAICLTEAAEVAEALSGKEKVKT